MNENIIYRINTGQHSYVAISVPKNSKYHKLISYNQFQRYISYQKGHDSHVFTPHMVQVNAEIIGLASSASENLKQLLIENNIFLKDWINNQTKTKVHDEILIIEIIDD